MAALAAVLAVTGVAAAQGPSLKLADRLAGPIDNATRATLTGSASPRAMHAMDLGAVPPSTPLSGIRVVFSRSAAQQADLLQLLAAQQDPASPLFHQWLTPAQFGARFGVSDNDLAATQSWLQSQGFTLLAVSPSRESLTVSGTESSIESAFGTPLHYFKSTAGSFNAAADTRTHIAPAHDLTLPAALSGLVSAVTNISDFRPHSNSVMPKTDFTSSVSGNHYLTPKDVAVIYDVNPAYNAGYTGSGQTIVVAGQSEILLSDIANFQSAAGVATNTPNLIPVPNTGSPYFEADGDEAESDLDLEYTSSIASKATIDFVYTGNNLNYGAFDAMIYAIQNGLGQIISLSYSGCEPLLGSSYINSIEGYLLQAQADGQTVLSASGDAGSTACYGESSSTAAEEQVAVGYPASSAYVTGVGGTEFPTADVAATNNTYFQPTTVTGTPSNDIVASALSYIPEQAWNDDSSTAGLGSGGGGVSIYITRPAWQAGVPGIPLGSYRLVPDVSLDSSPNNAGYLFCTSDTTFWHSGQAASCNSGFRDASTGDVTGGGGTSFATPIFAAMVAIINQAKGYNSGAGLINPTLYTLASNATTYASAFHDTPAGSGNQCLAGANFCSGASITDYPTTTGYDEATGLGSVDLYKLIAAWPKSTSSLLSSTTTATPATTTPALSAADIISIQVSGSSGTPTGTVAITDNGTAVANSPFTLNASGAYQYSYSSAVAGLHTIIVAYSGNTVYAASRATVTLNVGPGFTITGSNVAVTAGGTVTENLVFTSINSYSGTVVLNTYNAPSVNNACFTIPATSLTLTANQTVTFPITIYTNASNCPSTAYPLAQKSRFTAALRPPAAPGPASPWRSAPASALFASLLLAGCFKRRSRLLRAGLALGFVVALGLSGLGLMGCSNKSAAASSTGGGGTSTYAPTGTYSFSLTASDSVNSAITATSNTFTITIQ